MRINRIDLEGQDGRYATIKRRRGSGFIEITVLTPDHPGGRECRVAAHDEDALFKQASGLFFLLEGHRGTNSDIHEYYRELQRFTD